MSARTPGPWRVGFDIDDDGEQNGLYRILSDDTYDVHAQGLSEEMAGYIVDERNHLSARIAELEAALRDVEHFAALMLGTETDDRDVLDAYVSDILTAARRTLGREETK